MERFPSSASIKHSIEKLKQDNSVVVIGGQQAGILTGPLYTIHKVISIIKLAEEKEKALRRACCSCVLDCWGRPRLSMK